jgi:hypothetical protein
MTALHALPRLLWRPMTLLLLFLLGWTIALPLLMLWEDGVPLRALWEGRGGEPARNAAWHLIFMATATLGLSTALARLEADHARFAWTLPGLRRGLGASTVMLAVSAAAAAALLVSRASPTPGAWAAAFGVSLLAFAAASSALDPALPNPARWGGGLVVLAGVLRPGILARLVELSPWLAAAASTLVAVLIWRVQFSAAAARVRLERAAPDTSSMRYWSRRWQVERSWTRSLATDAAGPWLRGAAYERSGGRPTWMIMLVGATFVVVAARLMNDPGIALIFAAIFLSDGRSLLTPALPHPVSRRRRSDLAIAGCASEATMFVLLMGLLAGAVEALGVPSLVWYADSPPGYGWGLVLAMVFAWIPVVQWGTVRWAATAALAERAPYPGFWKSIALFIPFTLGAHASARILQGYPPLMTLLAAAAIAAVVWGLFALAVRWHYARADLVPRPA